MNLLEKKNQLIILIKKYLENKSSLKDLQEFSWDVIDFFNKTKKAELPSNQDFEKEFWFAIWQIQHLADEEHLKEGITKKSLEEALEYLERRKKIPDAFYGSRP